MMNKTIVSRNGTKIVSLTQEEISSIQAEETAWLNSQPSAFQIAMEDLRAKRNQLLADCDWTQFADSPLTAEQKFVYADYRQQLRDITNGLTTKEQVEAVVFPIKP